MPPKKTDVSQSLWYGMVYYGIPGIVLRVRTCGLPVLAGLGLAVREGEVADLIETDTGSIRPSSPSIDDGTYSWGLGMGDAGTAGNAAGDADQHQSTNQNINQSIIHTNDQMQNAIPGIYKYRERRQTPAVATQCKQGKEEGGEGGREGVREGGKVRLLITMGLIISTCI